VEDPVSPDRPEDRDDERRAHFSVTPWVSGGWLRAIAAAALVAVLTGRSIAPALPGSATGIGPWISWSERAAAYFTQLFVFAGCLVAVWLQLATLRERRLGFTYRVITVPVVAGVVTLVMASCTAPLTPSWILGLGACAAGLAAVATPRSLAAVQTRAAGLILGLGAIAAILQVAARVVAMHASDHALPALFSVARAVTTGATILEVVSLTVAAAWVAVARRYASIVGLLCVVGLAVVLSWGASRGGHYEASFWQVLTSRALAEMTRYPTPYLLPVLRHALEVSTLGLTTLVLLSRHRSHAVHAVVALVLLVRGATDIPVYALALTLAALIAPLASLHAEAVRTDGSPTSSDGDATLEPAEPEPATEEE
jgi:hypothetical protein